MIDVVVSTITVNTQCIGTLHSKGVRIYTVLILIINNAVTVTALCKIERSCVCSKQKV